MDSFSIPANIYMIIGSAVVLMSVLIGINGAGIEKMSIFVLVGAVFIVIGFVKFLSKEKKRSQHPTVAHAAHAQHQAATQQAAAHNPAAHHPAHVQRAHQHPASDPVPHKGGVHPAVVASTHHDNAHLRCPGCGTVIHPSFKYCHKCGHMLRN